MDNIDHSLDPMWEKLKADGKKLGLDYGNKPPVLNTEIDCILATLRHRIEVEDDDFHYDATRDAFYQITHILADAKQEALQATAREIFEEIERHHPKLATTSCIDYSSGHSVQTKKLLENEHWYQSLKSKYTGGANGNTDNNKLS